MQPNRESIFAEAMALPGDERAVLIKQLLESMDGPVDPDIEAAWIAEASRRIEAFDRGDINAMDGEPILRDLIAGLRP